MAARRTKAPAAITKKTAAKKARKAPQISIRALMREDVKREAAKAADKKAREVFKASRKREEASQRGWAEKTAKEREKASKEYYKAKDERRRAEMAAGKALLAARKARKEAQKPITALKRSLRPRRPRQAK